MPLGDHTGPMGQGPMTGKSSGLCSGIDTRGYVKGFGGGMGRGFIFGRGGGRGSGWGRNHGGSFAGLFPGFRWANSIIKDDEISILKSQAEYLKRFQKDIEKRLGELEKEGE
jgi:hypothetical protein